MYIGNANNYYNTLTIDFKKNIPDKTITLKFICDETHKTTYLIIHVDIIKPVKKKKRIILIYLKVNKYH